MSTIQNLALFDNVKNRNASKFIIENVRMSVGQYISYQLVAKCISCTSMPIWWSQSDQAWICGMSKECDFLFAHDLYTNNSPSVNQYSEVYITF